MEREPAEPQQPVPDDDPKPGDTNEDADERVEVVEPDGSPSPQAE